MMRRLACIALGLSISIGAVAAGTNGLSEAEIQGSELVQKILEQQPTENITNTGVLIIRNAHRQRSEIPVRFQTAVGTGRWSTTYEATTGSNRVQLTVLHETDKPNKYFFWRGLPKPGEAVDRKAMALSGSKTMQSFAGSDFWLADLGLEFLHWPEQKILKHYEMRRGRSCKVLESINPHPTPNGYSRVVSWIDNETLGIVQARAYDAKGELLKEFYPKHFKKVNGQWQVGEMEMINDRTDSRTWIKFDLKKRG